MDPKFLLIEDKTAQTGRLVPLAHVSHIDFDNATRKITGASGAPNPSATVALHVGSLTDGGFFRAVMSS